MLCQNVQAGEKTGRTFGSTQFFAAPTVGADALGGPCRFIPNVCQSLANCRRTLYGAMPTSRRAGLGEMPRRVSAHTQRRWFTVGAICDRPPVRRAESNRRAQATRPTSYGFQLRIRRTLSTESPRPARATKGRPYSRFVCRRYSPEIGNSNGAVCAGR